MRAISALFSTKRSEKPPPDAGTSSQTVHKLESKKPSRIFGSMARKPSSNACKSQTTAPVPPSRPRIPASSTSSTSSAGSQHLLTPRDDEGLLRSSSKASWKAWLGPKKPAAIPPQIRAEEWDFPHPSWNSRPPPVLLPPPSRAPPIDETDDDSTSEEEDNSDSASISPQNPQSASSVRQASSITNVRLTLRHSLRPPFSPPPLLHFSGQPMYPRSSNKRSSLFTQDSMATRMHKSRLVTRAEQLSRLEEIELRGFRAVKSTPDWPSCLLDDHAPPPMSHVRTYSEGLQKWSSRPCFEDRLVVWTSDAATGTVSCGQVIGTDLGVAALEISEALDALAGPVVDESVTIASGSSNSLLPSASGLVPNSQIFSSPLRSENNTSARPSAIRSSFAETDVTQGPVVRRGVRFADDDKDDQIPLSHVLRIKKNRDEKARFLRAEKARRALLEREQAAERKRHEAERLQWEIERRQWEMEKRAIEEDKRKQKYAEEVLLARQRREQARSGFYVPTPTYIARPQIHQSKSTPERSSSYLQSQRQGFELTNSQGSPYSESPSSSNPPSNNGDSPNGSGFFPRPESAGSANTAISSSEDVRQKMNANRRASFVSELAPQQMLAMPYYPVWGTPYAVPVMPGMPYYANLDMPLLPPAPPFMMQQSRRSQSPSSQSRSRSRSASPMDASGSLRGSSSDKLSISHRSIHSSRSESLQQHRRKSSDEGKPAASPRRSGSSTDIRDSRQSGSYGTAEQHTPIRMSYSTPSRSQTMWTSTSLSQERPSANRRSTVIT